MSFISKKYWSLNIYIIKKIFFFIYDLEENKAKRKYIYIYKYRVIKKIQKKGK